MESGGSGKRSVHSPLLDRCLFTLRKRESELRARGILHVGVFGSVARGEDDENSDIDVLVDVKFGMGFGLSGLVRLRSELMLELGRPVDVIRKSSLKYPKHGQILTDMVQAF